MGEKDGMMLHCHNMTVHMHLTYQKIKYDCSHNVTFHVGFAHLYTFMLSLFMVKEAFYRKSNQNLQLYCYTYKKRAVMLIYLPQSKSLNDLLFHKCSASSMSTYVGT